QQKPARCRPGGATEPAQQRPHIKQKADEHRDRIARQSDHDAVADLTEAHGASRLDGELPQVSLAQGIECRHQMIFLAAAGSARPRLAPPDVLIPWRGRAASGSRRLTMPWSSGSTPRSAVPAPIPAIRPCNMGVMASYTCPGRSALPGRTISSPLDRVAT